MLRWEVSSRTRRPRVEIRVHHSVRGQAGITDPIYPERTETYYVRGVNQHGYGFPLSITVARETAISTVPGSVLNFTFTELGTRDRYRLSPTRPDDFNGNDPVTTYFIYGSRSCAPSGEFLPYQPHRNTLRDFSAVVTYSFVDAAQGQGFGTKAKNSAAGRGECRGVTRELSSGVK